jgi:hypothetical protein
VVVVVEVVEDVVVAAVEVVVVVVEVVEDVVVAVVEVVVVVVDVVDSVSFSTVEELEDGVASFEEELVFEPKFDDVVDSLTVAEALRLKV